MKNGVGLMYDELKSRVDSKLLNKFSLFTDVGKADFNKKTIYWSHLPPVHEPINFFKDLGYSKRINHYVFTSYWQANLATEILGLPEDKVSVIKNATTAGDLKLERKNNKIKVCYTSSPFRGLDILLDAWKLIKPKDAELHIFSGTKLYGSHMHRESKTFNKELIKKVSSIQGAIYRDNIPHYKLKEQLAQFDILAYPSTFEETCCNSVIEAISTGLRVITTSYASMPEVTEGWAKLYPHYKNRDLHVKAVARLLKQEIEACKEGIYKEQSELQREVYGPAWSWDERVYEWEDLLSSL